MGKKEYYGYDAIFFDTETINDAIKRSGVKGVCLPKPPENYHITVAYHGFNEPTEEQKAFMESSRGMDVECTIIGYGNDGRNEGFLCEGHQENGTPFHITLSIAEDGKAVDTGKLEFERIDPPITITGKLHNSKDPELKDPKYEIDLETRDHEPD